MQLVETLVVYKKIDNQFIKIVLSRRKKKIMSLHDNNLIHDKKQQKNNENVMPFVLITCVRKLQTGVSNWFSARLE